MGIISERLLQIKLPPHRSAFLWGPRKVGKTYWIRNQFLKEKSTKKVKYIDLLNTEIFADYASRPALLRERWSEEFTVIDEIQKVPMLLDEVHWLIENKGAAFLLTGSSARKLKRGHANLLGGRAWRFEMAPLSQQEIQDFDLTRALSAGLIPMHYLSPDPKMDIRSYIADYLKEEIAAEALVQNIPAFSEFLRAAALTSGELINYKNIGSECGVSHKVVRQYYQILEDTLLGFRVPAWKKSVDRRMIQSEKFYLFDVGVTNYLAKRHPEPGNTDFGKSFEHFILMELMSYKKYRNPDMELNFWKTSTDLEVDFILGNMDLAIEVKSRSRIDTRDIKNLKIVKQEHKAKHTVLVSTEMEPKKIDGITVLPWANFLERLWNGDFL